LASLKADPPSLATTNTENFMMRFKRKNSFSPPQFAVASAGCLGTTQKYAIERTWPLEEILLHVDITCGATGPTPRTGSTGQVGLDALLGVIEMVDLSINDGVQPRSIVNFSGIGLLEYVSKVALNLDAATLEAVRLWNLGAAYANNLKYRMTIRIPLVHPLITEPLRGRCLLPVHTFPQDPILTIKFQSATNMYSAGSISDIQVHVDLIRREMSAAETKQILDSKGFINFDLLEAPNTVGVGVSGKASFDVSTPGYYANLLIRSYLGGATVTRDVLDQTTTFASETLWTLETGGTVLRDWRWKQLQDINQQSMPLNGLTIPQSATTGAWAAPTSAGSPTVAINPSPTIGGYVTSGQGWQASGSYLHDFLTDDFAPVNELGSCLDCEFGTKQGLKMQVKGFVASVATNGSSFYIGGHRFYDSPILQSFMA
jgi:hypothetical protein